MRGFSQFAGTILDAFMNEHIEQFFTWGHLPEHLQEISKPFGSLARQIIDTLPQPGAHRGTWKLLEAKDAAVRAKLAKTR